ncbi:MAG: 5-(carboxyamino)imidazole ribonucleotide synthase [Vampirovibrionales bacterium]|nr:5-(carboxyamino)imidazole ribonucleotide synthase [Vampirovibrionales bacterium]
MPVSQSGCLGLLGGGQLGQMFALAATKLGYRVIGLWPEADAPAEGVCEQWIQAEYTDEKALDTLSQLVAGVTIEFENIPVNTLQYLSQKVPVYPAAKVLEVTQDRLAEKRFIQSLGLPTTPFVEVRSEEALMSGLKHLGQPAVLKTTRFGYDGKGQKKIPTPESARIAWQALQPHADVCEPLILEQWQSLKAECALFGARNTRGEMALMPLTQTWHRNHILHRACWPAQPDVAAFERPAQKMLLTLMEAFNLTGVLCVEFFITESGNLLINELAPRPHNAFHWTMEGCTISQFELQVAAMTTVPLLNPVPIAPCLMQNILGDSYRALRDPALRSSKILSQVTLNLHDYGKIEPRAGRKMAHLTAQLPQGSKPWQMSLADEIFSHLA